ncbi:MAG TPA: TetR/AcrR family transcriptional regulator [Ktedonobacterales bacterium]
MTTISDGLRKPGRPRSAQAHQKILQAALQLLVEEGYKGMSLEGVAERARVGKTTIYRRWKSKEELVMDVIRSIHAEVPVIDTGNFREDILTMLRGASLVSTPLLRGLLVKTLGEISSHPEILQVFNERLVAPRFGRLFEMIERAKERGEIRPDLDDKLIVSLLAGPYFFYVLFDDLTPGPPLTTETAERLGDAVLRGMAASESEHET